METTTTSTATSETTAPAAARSFAEQTLGEKMFSLAIFGLGAAVSGAFIYYMITDPGRLTELWAWTRSQNILVQGAIWLLFLPWMLCLWVWTMPWAVPIRFVLVIAALVWTNWMLFPWK